MYGVVSDSITFCKRLMRKPSELLLCWEHYKKGFPQKRILNTTLESSGEFCLSCPLILSGIFVIIL